MAKEIKITDEKFLEVSTRLAQEITPSFIEYFKVGLVLSAIAAELFGDEDEEKKESKFVNLFEKDVDDMRYCIYTGGDVCKDDFVLLKETLSTQKVVYTRRFKTFEEAVNAFVDEVL